MPRKSKTEELRMWVSVYHTFMFEVDFSTYKMKVSILSMSKKAAEDRLLEIYPQQSGYIFLNETLRTHL